jgi:hypothetical protein
MSEIEREEYLRRVRARMRGEPDPAPKAVLTPTLAIAAPEPPAVLEVASASNVAQPSPYSESTAVHTVDAFHDRVVARHDLDEAARTLTRESLEVLVVVARRLARAEERAP